jgi:hypothetical protein
MNYPYTSRVGGPDPLTASLPPPALTFVARILLAGIAAVAGIALIASAPLAVTLPLGSIFGTYLLATLVFTVLERRRVRRVRRPRRAPGASSPADRSTLRVGTIAAASIIALGAAFVAPERFGIGLAALGFAGLLTARILASAAGWAPRYTFPKEVREMK